MARRSSSASGTIVLSSGWMMGDGGAGSSILGAFARMLAGSVAEVDHAILSGGQDGAEHGHLEFTHVAGPGVGLQGGHARLGDRVDRRRALVLVALQELLGQSRDVLATDAQGREHHREHVEAAEEVLAELARLDKLPKVAVRRGDEPRLDGHDALAAVALDDARLEDPDELLLRLHRAGVSMPLMNSVPLARPARIVLRRGLRRARRPGPRPGRSLQSTCTKGLPRCGLPWSGWCSRRSPSRCRTRRSRGRRRSESRTSST